MPVLKRSYVIHGCYRVLPEAVAAAEFIPKCGRDRVLLADSLLRAGWRPPNAR